MATTLLDRQITHEVKTPEGDCYIATTYTDHGYGECVEIADAKSTMFLNAHYLVAENLVYAILAACEDAKRREVASSK